MTLSDYHTDPADSSSWVASNKNYALGIRADSKTPTMGGVFCEGNGHAEPHLYMCSRRTTVLQFQQSIYHLTDVL